MARHEKDGLAFVVAIRHMHLSLVFVQYVVQSTELTRMREKRLKFEIGEILYWTPNLAITYVGEDKYLVGEQVVNLHLPDKMPAMSTEVREGFIIAMVGGRQGGYLPPFPRLTVEQARGYAMAIYSLPHSKDDTVSPRMSAWAYIQVDADSLFLVRPYIEKLMEHVKECGVSDE